MRQLSPGQTGAAPVVTGAAEVTPWAAGVAYGRGQQVTYGGSLLQAAQPNTGQTPNPALDTPYWNVLVRGGQDGAAGLPGPKGADGAGAPWKAYRHFRLDIPPGWGGAAYFTSIAQIGLYAGFGGDDVGRTAGATYTASAFYNDNFVPARAFDADPATYWAIQGAVGWIQVSFQEPVAVGAYSVQAISDPAEVPLRWRLLVSNDGVTWAQAHAAPSEPLPWQPLEIRTFLL